MVWMEHLREASVRVAFNHPTTLAVLMIDTPIYRNARVVVLFPFWLAFDTPIPLQKDDQVLIDIHTCELYIIERAGIAIWRSDWKN